MLIKNVSSNCFYHIFRQLVLFCTFRVLEIDKLHQNTVTGSLVTLEDQCTSSSANINSVWLLPVAGPQFPGLPHSDKVIGKFDKNLALIM